VSNAARLGAQLGDATKACVNVRPSFASRSMFGVGTLFPPNGEQSERERSSARNNTMFGAANAGEATSKRNVTKRNRM
jgi:hypothetical protein